MVIMLKNESSLLVDSTNELDLQEKMASLQKYKDVAEKKSHPQLFHEKQPS